MSGFFFCGIRLDPVAISSPRITKPNSALAQSTMSSPRRLRWIATATHAYARSSAKSRSDTASMLFSVSRVNPSSRATTSRRRGNVLAASAPDPRGISPAAS